MRYLSLLIVLLICAGANAQEPRLVLPVGHTSVVNSAVFSTNENFILTASDDYTTRIWDARTGRLIHTFEGHSGELMKKIILNYMVRYFKVSYDEAKPYSVLLYNALIKMLL